MAYTISDEHVQAIADEYRPHVVEGHPGQMEECVRDVIASMNGTDPTAWHKYPPLVVTAVRLDVERFVFDGGPDWWQERNPD